MTTTTTIGIYCNRRVKVRYTHTHKYILLLKNFFLLFQKWKIIKLHIFFLNEKKNIIKVLKLKKKLKERP